KSLREAVLEGRVRGDDVIEVIVEIGSALEAAHQAGLVHRDVKPANILLDDRGRAKLTDFDLVRVLDAPAGTTAGMMGTLHYAAPECLVRGRDAGPTADIYSLAMTAIFALHGHELDFEVVMGVRAFIAALDCPESLKPVLLKATAYAPKDRF